MPHKFHDVRHIAEFLHKIQPFNALESEELDKLARRLEAEYCPQGKTIFSSRPAPGLAIIRKGVVRLVDENTGFWISVAKANCSGTASISTAN